MNKNFVVGLVVALMLFVSTGSAFSAETLADVSTKANNANVKAEATKGGLVAEIANRVDGDVNLQSQIDNIQLTGATGPQGLEGPIGLPGPQGISGLKGDKGDTGATGATGATGPQGLDGADGKDGGSGVRNANYLFARSYVQMKVYNAVDILEVFSKGVQIDKQSDDSVLKVTLSERFRSQYVAGLMYYVFVDGVFAGHLGNIYDSLAYATSANVHVNFTAISPQGNSRIYAGVHFVEIRVKPVAVNSADHAWIAFDSSYLEVEEINDASLM